MIAYSYLNNLSYFSLEINCLQFLDRVRTSKQWTI